MDCERERELTERASGTELPGSHLGMYVCSQDYGLPR